MQIKKKKSELLISIAILLLVLALRLLTSAAPNVYHSYDTGNITLAVQDYNIAEERPHLPGYYLHVMIIRLFNFTFHNTHFSMIFLSALYSALGTMLFYKISRKFLNILDSLLLTLLIVTNPLVWFYGSVPEIYSFDFFFSSLLIYLSFNRKFIYLIPAVFALGAGIRQSSVIILLPLYISVFYIYYKETKDLRTLLLSQIIGIACFAAWFLPFISSVGGINTYLYLIRTQNPLPDLGFSKNVLQMLIYLFWLVLPFICVFPFFKTLKFKSKNPRYFLNQFLILFIPSLLMFTFVHYTRGYWLIAIPSTFLLLGLVMSENKKARFVIWIITVFQMSYFLFFPYKILSIEQFYSPKARSESQFYTLTSRLMSQNSVSLNHIKALNDFQSDIKTGLDTRSGKRFDFKHTYILLDPTVPVNERALQASFPKYTFAKLNLKKPDAYFIFKDKKQIPMTNRHILLNNSIIIGLDLIEKNISKDIEILFRLNSLIFYKALNDSNNALQNKYDYYFQK